MGYEIKIKSEPNDDIISLRREVFVLEKDFVKEDEILSIDDMNGKHICIYDGSRLIAAILAVKASGSFFSSKTNSPSSSLDRSIYVTRAIVRKDYRATGFWPLLIYLALREGRMQGLDTCVTLFANKGYIEPIMKMDWLDLDLAHNEHPLYAGSVDIDYAMYRAWKAIPQELKDLVLGQDLLISELIQHAITLTKKTLSGCFFKKANLGELTKVQYTRLISNNYQFVQWTTRLLAQISGITSDSTLRNHFLKHLSEEVDHERIVERDLIALGQDVDYVKNGMIPNVHINQFMCVQESLASFRRDPVNFLAIPIAIESLTAHLGIDFIKDIHRCAEKWGIENPSKVTHYLAFHMEFDGGDDGHWQESARMIGKLLHEEKDLRSMMTTVSMILNAMNSALESFVQ